MTVETLPNMPTHGNSRVAPAIDAQEAPQAPYGGYRLHPSHFEPDRVPPEVHRYSAPLDTLPIGSPGKVGLLELEFAKKGSRTELVGQYQKSPLQIMRPLYYDPVRPDMPYTYLMSTGGGIVQGDRLRTDLTFGPNSCAHITTAAHTKIYKMSHDYAAAQTNITVSANSYVEYLPDPMIPFAGARIYQRTRVTLDETATLIVGETIYAGRIAHDERYLYDVMALDFEVRRPDGRIITLDRLRLCPEQGRHGGGLSTLGDRNLLAMLYVLAPPSVIGDLADRLHSELAFKFPVDLTFGISALPNDAGISLRSLADDPITITRANTAAWGLVREFLTGRPPPTIRKN